MSNKTAVDQCGEENSCSGSGSNFICICNGYGYKLDDLNNQMCTEGESFLCCILSLFYYKPFEPSPIIAKIFGRKFFLYHFLINHEMFFPTFIPKTVFFNLLTPGVH